MKNKENSIYNIIKYLFSLLIILFFLLNISKGKIKKDNLVNSLKPLDQEGQNYRLVTSADNVQVPVPKGYVASNVTGENYVSPEYQHTTNSHNGEYTELTWSSPAEQQYPWTQDDNGIWVSGNQGIPNSESVIESEEFDYIKGTTLTLTLNYTYSCDYADHLEIYIIDVTNNISERIVEASGNNDIDFFDINMSDEKWLMNPWREDWETGKYKFRAKYTKDHSIDEGYDCAYIKPSIFFKEDEYGTETIEEDIKTKIHDGGFVIYELTDGELETNPNGTNVIINDTNKDTAQRIRNQYVWVPVPNIEDIVRTKTENDGIMQFGQGYRLSYFLIAKETNTEADYFREPRLVERYDITKYHLQRYSNIGKRENYLNKMQEDYVRMIKSINKYKGFYIGRYETGDDISHSSSENCFTNPKVVRYNSNIRYVTWYDSYKDLERLAGKTGKYVETGMIYDSLWDYTLKWLNDTDTKSCYEINIDSGTWGNYLNNWSMAQSGGLPPAKTGALETIIYRGEKNSDSPSSSNNIFDMAGNVDEWTRSRQTNNLRRARGGSYRDASNESSVKEHLSKVPYTNSDNYGVRGMLLIK